MLLKAPHCFAFVSNRLEEPSSSPPSAGPYYFCHSASTPFHHPEKVQMGKLSIEIITLPFAVEENKM